MTLQLNLSEKMMKTLDLLVKQRETFIIEAIEEKIEREKKKQLITLLEQGYKATSEEDLLLTQEFEAIDFENL